MDAHHFPENGLLGISAASWDTPMHARKKVSSSNVLFRRLAANRNGDADHRCAETKASGRICRAYMKQGVLPAHLCGESRGFGPRVKRGGPMILGRLTERFKTMIWCRRARISVWSARRDRKPARRTDDNEIRMFCINGEAISPIP